MERNKGEGKTMSLVNKLIAGGALMLAAGCNELVFEGKIGTDDVKLTKSVPNGSNFELVISKPGCCLYDIIDMHREGQVDYVCIKCNSIRWHCQTDKMLFEDVQKTYSSHIRYITERISPNIKKIEMDTHK